ncbi:Imm7 family immunity protein [Leptospira kirschneri]|uniref:Imm7 family immunity protein n=1 Tax=Leptospira kirschneri TaxID=29507 RepID=UPI0002EABC9D|nr:Imm7 family immunity protein [Leptospira kirschneri]
MGSYGLLYIHDEEDDKNEIDHSNEFVVWKLARGHLNQEKDPFLSPFPRLKTLMIHQERIFNLSLW